jgi:hypothetical protein
MIASVTDLQEYRRTHPPAVRCFLAVNKCFWNWAALAWYPWVICSTKRRPTT